MVEPTNGPISSLRSDFETYKTQVTICAWCGVVVILCLIGAVIYAFILIRKIRNEIKEKLREPDPVRKFTINRPKLLPWYDPLSKFQYEAALKSRFDNKYYNRVPRVRSHPSISTIATYENINSPAPWRNSNNSSSFLNRTREIYNPSKGEAQLSPRTPSTPGYEKKDGHFF